jgi:hypothetical protein
LSKRGFFYAYRLPNYFFDFGAAACVVLRGVSGALYGASPRQAKALPAGFTLQLRALATVVLLTSFNYVVLQMVFFCIGCYKMLNTTNTFCPAR